MTDYEPGIHPAIDEQEYHRLPGLSSTGIKRMLQAPAVYRWHTDHPQPHRKQFDVGHAVHAKVLGVGLPVAVVPPELLGANGSASTKAAREWIADARAEGLIVLKQEEVDEVNDMAEAVLTHEDAGPLLTGAQPEVSLLWDDEETGHRMRGRIDYVRHERLLVDLKTAASASPATWGQISARLGYDTQKIHYSTGWHDLTGTWPRFVNVVVTKERPFLVFVAELTPEFDEIAAENVRAAIDLYAHCTAAGAWPGFGTGIHRTSPPRWHGAGTDLLEEYAA